MAEQLTFFGWFRPPGHSLAGGNVVTVGRLAASLDLTVSDADDPSDKRTRRLDYDLLGPGDVTGLRSAAVVRTYPSPGSRAVESDKAVYAELAAPDLPWRYTLDRPATEGAAALDRRSSSAPPTRSTSGARSSGCSHPSLDAHPLSTSARLAHVETDSSGHTVARLISPRALAPARRPRRGHRARLRQPGGAVVADPAVRAGRAARLLLLDLRDEGRRRLRRHRPPAAPRSYPDPTSAPPTVQYGPLPDSAPMPVAGALTATGPPPAGAVPQPVAADLRQLTKRSGDATHPVLGLPDLAESWPGDGTAPAPPGWRDALRADYRSRAVAGLGERAGDRPPGAPRRPGGPDRRRLPGGRRPPAPAQRRTARLPVAVGPQGPDEPDPTPRRPRACAAGRADRLRAGRGGDGAPRPGPGPQPVLRPRRSARCDPGPRLRRPTPWAQTSATPCRSLPPRRPRRPAAHPGRLHTDSFARAARRPALDDVVQPTAPALTRLRTITTALAQNLDRRDLDPDTSTFVDAQLEPGRGRDGGEPGGADPAAAGPPRQRRTARPRDSAGSWPAP